MDILETLVKLLEYALVPVVRQFGYVIFYNRNIDGLKKEAENLKAAREDVENEVRAAENNNKVIGETVQLWKRRVGEITEQADRFFEKESDANTGCSRKSCPNLWLRYKLSRRAKKMAAEVGDLNRERNSVSVSTGRKLPPGVGNSSVVGEIFDSRVETMNEIMESLADPAIHVIGLYGIGGVGKTTLAKQVAKKAQDGKLFDKVLFIEVKKYEIEEIQSQIACLVGLEFDVESKNETIRANQLHQRLEKENSFLIVLDDLWERLDFKQVGIAFAVEGKTHCKFILTSRKEDLLSAQMNCKKNIMVGLLSKEEAWGLFKKTAEINDNDNSDLVSKAIEVSQKCAQLPVAIVAVAGALRNNKSLADWRDALRRLKGYSSRNISGIKEVDSSIRLSYDYLENKELKPIFLLSAMFSQDPLIMDLFMYVVGLELLEGIHDLKEARDALDSSLRKLKASSLLLDSYSKDRFTIHDVVRDVALSIAFDEYHALVKRREKVDEWPNKNQLERCTAICLDECDIDELPKELYGPKVEFFYLHSKDIKLNIPSNLFSRMEELKVLSLSNMTFSSLASFSLPKKLTTLSLHYCKLEDITAVKHLKELKVLNLSNSRIKQLPCEVGQLSCLKILNLSRCYQLEVIPPNLLSNLKKLEELYMRASFNRWEAKGLNKGKERASLDELKHLQKLSALEICIPDTSVLPKDLFLENSLERYNISIGRYDRLDGCEFSRVLTLSANNNINMEYGVFMLFERVENLTLESLNDIASLYQSQITTQIFCNLQAIKVNFCDQLEYFFSVSMTGTLAILETIEVSACKSLEEIVAFVDEENVEKGSTTNVIELHQLGSLTLDDLPVLTNFCFSNQVTFPNLETLILASINCPNIWDIFTSKSSGTQSHVTAQTFCKLGTIKVSSCDKLKSLFLVSMAGVLSRLESIEVSKCKSLEEIVAFEDNENVEKGSAMNVIEFHQLRFLKLNDLSALTDFCFSSKVAFPKLETLSLTSVNCHNIWHIPTSTGSRTQIVEIVESSQTRTAFNDSLPERCFSNLKTLKVGRCHFLLKLIPLYMLKSLSNLEELEIKDCVRLEVVFDFGEFKNYKETHTFRLKTLLLSDLPTLEAVWSRGLQGIISFQSLQKLEIRNCNKLEIFQAVDEKVFPKLEELILSGRQAKMMWNGEFGTCHFSTVKVLSLSRIYDKVATFPCSLLYGFPISEQLDVSWSSFLVIFSCPKRPLDNDARKVTSIKRLRLSRMQKLKHIWDGKCQLDHILQNLKALNVSHCDELINLGPSFVSLENLTELDVNRCNGLINLLTSSTAKTLVQLASLKITSCEKMEEIITNGEDVENEIVFVKLKKLTLDQLPNCKSFCCYNHTFNFPLLDEVTIEACSRFRIFCPGILITTLLKGVKVGNGEIRWQNNLNDTIQQLFDDKGSLFADLKNLVVKNDEYPELIDIWSGKLASGRYFTNLTSLVMDNCNFLSNHVIPSYILTSFVNLRELEVRNCDSVEVVFDLEGLDIDKEAHTLQAIPLRFLTIEHLPNLKYVWNKDPHTIHCFQHLEKMIAYECENLRSIFPSSIARVLTKLKRLKIESCGIEVIVAENQTPTSTSHFVFPKLQFLYLIKLPNLKNFYPQRHTVEWPKLKSMNVRQCKKMKVFSWEVPDTTEKEAEDGVENDQHPLFLFEKVVPQLRSLVLNQNHVKIIRNGQIQEDIFNKVDSLTLDSFYEDEPLDFPYTFIERFPELLSLEVSHSSFKSIFPCEGHLVPSSASFDHLQRLYVSGCHCLGYLLTTLTAKSLVHLKSLVIKDCKIMEEIVTNKGEDVEDKIVFKKLNHMELIDLPDLKSFSSQICTFEFPSLAYVTVRGCSKMKMFCPKILITPLLENMKIEENEERWEGDLNETLEKLFLEKEGQDSLKR